MEQDSLRALQSRFRRAIVSSRDEAPSRFSDLAILETPGSSVAERFDVYHSAYRLRLGRVLEDDFLLLAKVAPSSGELDSIFSDYIENHPSRYASLDEFGQGLPAFLAETAPWAGSPELAAVAQLDWITARAFLAPTEQGAQGGDRSAVLSLNPSWCAWCLIDAALAKRVLGLEPIRSALVTFGGGGEPALSDAAFDVSLIPQGVLFFSYRHPVSEEVQQGCLDGVWAPILRSMQESKPWEEIIARLENLGLPAARIEGFFYQLTKAGILRPTGGFQNG